MIGYWETVFAHAGGTLVLVGGLEDFPGNLKWLWNQDMDLAIRL